LNSGFCFFEAVLFSNSVRKPEICELNKMVSKFGKKEVEFFYNHFHMSAITNDLNRQRDYSVMLWNKWRSFFNQKMPINQIAIEICDLGNEIILYVYEIVL
jgi:hypothetical protein